MRHPFLLIALLWLLPGYAQYSVSPPQELVHYDLNQISDATIGLQKFYHELVRLERGERQKVTIVHIGDSHLQAGFLGGRLRMELQKRFGNAGRGLVFPYRLAQTNSPLDIRAESSSRWNSTRLIKSNGPFRSGISGHAIQTQQPDFFLELFLRENEEGLDYSFDKVTLFHSKGPGAFACNLTPAPETPRSGGVTKVVTRAKHHLVSPGENLSAIAKEHGCTVSQVRFWNQIKGDLIFPGQLLIIRYRERIFVPNRSRGVEFSFDNTQVPQSNQATSVFFTQTSDRLYLKGHQTQNSQHEFTLYGLNLENTRQSGILYHMIGINGAQFRHFERGQQNLMEQLKELNPDLVIISLGTNEAMNSRFSAVTFYKQVDQLVQQMRWNASLANILVTTPPDAKASGSYVSRNMSSIRSTLTGYARNHGLAFWDFYQVMGGAGGIQNWATGGLAQQDLIHLNKTGYELQATLLFDALMNGYQAYRSHKP
ncbi:MAG: GDSL-type esterase/lipase family protein [Bacteroidota bacterium]